MPADGYAAHATKKRLDGYRICVIREYMDKDLFTVADSETVDIVDRAIDDLKALGATVVDPGPHGALFQSYVDKYTPKWQHQQFIPQFPGCSRARRRVSRRPTRSAVAGGMFFNPALVPHTSQGRPSIRSLGGAGSGDTGDGRYNFNAYIRERGDAAIHSLTDLINKANHWSDPNIPSRRPGLVSTDAEPHAEDRGRAADALHVADGRLRVLRGEEARRRGLPDGEHSAGALDLAGIADGQRSQRRPVDLHQQPRLPGDDRPRGLHEARLRPQRPTRRCCRRTRRRCRSAPTSSGCR